MWLGLVLVFIAAAGVGEAAEFPVTQFGAVADDEAPDTAAIQAAIDACGQAGGGRVLFPTGHVLVGDAPAAQRRRIALAARRTADGSQEPRRLRGVPGFGGRAEAAAEPLASRA